MREVYIHCPITGLAVATGVLSRDAELKQSDLQGTIENCPACQDSHHWIAEEAWLAVERVSPPNATDAKRLG